GCGQSARSRTLHLTPYTSHQFHCHRRRLAAADAKRCDAALEIALFQGMEEGGHDACAGCADRVAQCAGTAVDVHLCMIELEIMYCRHRHARKRFVDLE